jgi:anti-sigma regulatory factor (Ser/Thr protein kinase)
VPASLDSLGAAEAFVATAARAAGVSEDRIWKVQLALEEVLVNVFRYAYAPGEAGSVSIGCSVADGGIFLRIRDSGRPFDPLAHHAPDLGGGIEDRAVGGLGIFLLREMADGVAYHRLGDANQLTLEFRAGA